MTKYLGEPGLLMVLRHGQIQGHDIRRFIGTTDAELDDTGVGQAESWHGILSGFSFKAVYSSPLKRCLNTAAQICPCSQPIMDDRLTEIHMGAWENLSFDSVKKAHPEAFERRGRHMDTFTPPGGESFSRVSERAWNFFSSNKGPLSGPILVVTHAGVIRTLLCRIYEVPLTELFTFKPSYGELFLISATN